MDIRDYNRTAWDSLVQSGNRWTIPASREVIAAARQGEWEIFIGEDAKKTNDTSSEIEFLLEYIYMQEIMP